MGGPVPGTKRFAMDPAARGVGGVNARFGLGSSECAEDGNVPSTEKTSRWRRAFVIIRPAKNGQVLAYRSAWWTWSQLLWPVNDLQKQI
jgi:hypothetical protein